MRSISNQCLLCVPALLALLLLALFATPLSLGGISLAPNIAWVMTLVMVSAYPSAWPRSFAFCFGLLQDVVFGTPLGAQGLLTLLLLELAIRQAPRQALQSFPLRWLEAAGMLLLWHGLLAALYHFVTPHAPSLFILLRMGVVSAIWYPLFYAVLTRIMLHLPPLK